MPELESSHRLVNPESLAPPIGFAHAVLPAPGQIVFLGGQAAIDDKGLCRGGTLVEQFDFALENLVKALEACNGRPEHLVSMQIFVTDTEEYRRSLHALGERYRRHLGRYYPAMALFGVNGLWDPAAKVELMCIAVVPDTLPN